MKMSSQRKSLKDEARYRLRKLYNPEPYDFLTVVEVLESLKKIQRSPNKSKRSVLRCVIQEIFETRKYFPGYSLYQLMKIGHMFGGIIEYGLTSNDMDLNEAYDYILNALKQSPESNIFCFGIMALDRIKHLVIKNWKYCLQISTIPHFSIFPPELLKCINSGKNRQKNEKLQKSVITVSQESPKTQRYIGVITTDTAKPDAVTSVLRINSKDTVRSSEHFTTNSVKVSHAERSPIAGTKSQYDDKTMMEPPENVQQKIAFIFNNLNQKNVKKKCTEVKAILKRRHLPWLSEFLIKRICNESQLHSLYLTCLLCFNSAPLDELIELETARTIKVLLVKDKLPQTKTLLKNMGHWLGLITFAKNKPTSFDLETMVIEAYVKGGDELAFVLPFVAKTLESCINSTVYGPKTSSTLSILNCLAELHQTPGLKLVFQFEIELICKALNVKLEELSGYKLMNRQYKFTSRKKIYRKTVKLNA